MNDLTGQVIQDTYRLERVLGRGGMGVVYEASHTRLARRFAVKVLAPEVDRDPQALARFQLEAQITSTLGHRHIVEVVDFNHTTNGVPYIVMELLEGEDLGQVMARQGPMDLAEVWPIFEQAASALHAAHRKGVVHRDLKPQNIFLCRREDQEEEVFIKVVDFGISKVVGSHSGLTNNNMLLGTPFYMAPEQVVRPGEVDQRTDVYSMAVIVYQMLTGKTLFIGDSFPQVIFQLISAAPEPLARSRPDLPRTVCQVVDRAISKEQQARYASMAEFWEAFAAAAGVGQGRERRMSPAAVDLGQTLPPPSADSEGLAAAAYSETVPSAHTGPQPRGEPADDGATTEYEAPPAAPRSRWRSLLAVGLPLVVLVFSGTLIALKLTGGWSRSSAIRLEPAGTAGDRTGAHPAITGEGRTATVTSVMRHGGPVDGGPPPDGLDDDGVAGPADGPADARPPAAAPVADARPPAAAPVADAGRALVQPRQSRRRRTRRRPRRQPRRRPRAKEATQRTETPASKIRKGWIIEPDLD